MPNNLKINPIGKDARIQSLQKRLYSRLNTKWGIELTGYGRVYLNEKDKFVIAEAYVKKAGYSGTLLTSDASKFFFVAGDKSKALGQTMYETSIDVCFIVDLSNIKPAIAHRADSEAQADVEKILQDSSDLGVTIESLQTGRNVFKGLKYDALKDDMQPKHYFKFTITLIYGMSSTEC